MADNAFDMVRKIRHLPGLQLTATLNPTLISKRVKTAAQKMLRTGVLTSGYRSQARMLAEQLLNDAGRVAPVSVTKWWVFIPDAALLTDEARAAISELVDAARVVELTSEPRSNSKYINERYDHTKQQIKAVKVGRLSFNAYQLELDQQISELVAACRTPLMVEIHNELADMLADMLDGTEPFAINF